jgi:valyl-tRNA synthetase
MPSQKQSVALVPARLVKGDAGAFLYLYFPRKSVYSDTYMALPEKLTKPYNPQETEPRVYKLEEESGLFNPDIAVAQGFTAADAKPYTIILPPPNVTGVLHMGHALMVTIQDILIRFHRLKGYKTLWLPGTDHAAIATQSVVEKKISKEEGKSRYDVGRDELLRRIGEFAQSSHDTIVGQMKVLGASLDWSREAFTLDEKRTRAVYTVFEQMYNDGLIFRGNRIVNWDPKGQTTISDDEIVYEARKAKLYTFKYAPDFPIAISTTRPETKVGDVAVAVHPSDERYREYVGKEYDLEFCGAPIHVRIVADESVEKEFGTGALGVTPAHSAIDWEIANRHDLPRPQVINEYAKITNIPATSPIFGKKVAEARELVVAWLTEQNLLIEAKEIEQNITTAERTGGIIEPLPKLQWFVNVNKPIPARGNKTLKELMREPVESGRIAIHPDYFGKTYFHWIDNLRDWCISRQIWYGHRIPVWYKDTVAADGTVKQEIMCTTTAPVDSGWKQDEDTLDTWFSSALWTFSTLGWPEKTPDLKMFHPTDVLETGYEILFFWVARMILMSQYVLGEIPFKHVYLHGTVRDAQGRKMSKTLGNGLDPLEIAKEFGSDAGRMALIYGTAPGTDSKISKDKIKGYRNFANKVWNISRFILESTEGITYDKVFTAWTPADKAHIEKRDQEFALLTRELDEFNLHIAAERIYQYLWKEVADTIIEESKPILKGTDMTARESRGQFLLHTLRTSLVCLHPFMPHLTNELWTLLPFRSTRPLLVEEWPVVRK